MQSGVPFLARSPSRLEAKSRQHDVLGTVALGTGLIVGSCALLATLALILPALLS
jgi:hypothetical protein